jgi:hypothetical protein
MQFAQLRAAYPTSQPPVHCLRPVPQNVAAQFRWNVRAHAIGQLFEGLPTADHLQGISDTIRVSAREPVQIVLFEPAST